MFIGSYGDLALIFKVTAELNSLNLSVYDKGTSVVVKLRSLLFTKGDISGGDPGFLERGFIC